MKHGLRILLLLSALTLLLSGCDFFRTIAGRPTSEELAAKKEAIAAAAVPADTLKAAADSLVAGQDSLNASGDTLCAPEASPAPAAVETAKPEEPKAPAAPAKLLSKKYYIVVGTFSSEENARKLVSKAEEKSFPAVLFPFRGMIGVAVCGTDSKDEIMAQLPKVRSCGLFPKESWVYTK